MRVLIVGEQLRRAAPGGIGTYVRGVLQGLAALDGGVEVALLASRARSAPDPLAATGVPVRASRLPGPVLTRLWDRGLLRAPGGFQVVHAPSLAVPPASAPVVAAVHDVAWRSVPEAYPRRGRRWHEAALARAVRRAACLVAPTKETAAAVSEAGAERVVVLEPMYGCDHLPPADAHGAARLLEELGVRGPYLLTVSTLEPRKNLVRLLDAFRRARPALPEPWPLVVVGPQGWGQRLPPAPGVVLAGDVPPAVLAALYAGARCLVYVPLVEGYGLPPVEAMAACTPVVASPLPSTGSAALEVDPLDVDAIAAALVEAAADDRTRAELVTAGLLHVQELTWRNVAARHRALWRSLA